MEIPVLEGPAELKGFAQKCAEELFKQKPHPFEYPEDCMEQWVADEITEKNENFLESLTGNANLYAIFIRDRGVECFWEKKYVGHSNKSLMRGRIRAHLVKKDYRTGSVLEEIKTAVSLNKEVGLSFINVKPDSLRLFVEDEIIKTNKKMLEWNRHGKKEDGIL